MGRRPLIDISLPQKSYIGDWQAHEKMHNIANHQGNTQWDMISHLLKWLSSKSLQITNIDEDVVQRDL